MSSLAGWHVLDIFFVILTCYFVIMGVFRGLVGEALSLGGLILTAYIGFGYSDKLGALLGRASGLNPYVSQVLTLVVVWLVISMFFSFLRSGSKKALSMSSLGGIDRILGIICGLLKASFVIYAVLIAGLLLSPVVEPTWMSKSDVLVYAGRKWPDVRNLLVGIKVLPKGTELPSGTLEQILRPYRRGVGAPGTYNGAEAWALPGRKSKENGGWTAGQ